MKVLVEGRSFRSTARKMRIRCTSVRRYFKESAVSFWTQVKVLPYCLPPIFGETNRYRLTQR